MLAISHRYLGLALGLLVVASQPVSAQQRIGEASSVKNSVVRVSLNATQPLQNGGSVFKDEIIRTGKASSTQLAFIDQTNLAVGPSSSVKLDRFVFDGSTANQAVRINLLKGAFRFATGRLDKRAYRIQTSSATIGVRGTVLDIRNIDCRLDERAVLSGRSIGTLSCTTHVTLVDNGAALVCANGSSKCVELDRPGQSVRIRRNRITKVLPNKAFSFSGHCNQNPGLCQPVNCN
jgi:ferric-dicitrate binding protein FerR (iron transport regulator)